MIVSHVKLRLIKCCFNRSKPRLQTHHHCAIGHLANFSLLLMVLVSQKLAATLMVNMGLENEKKQKSK